MGNQQSAIPLTPHTHHIEMVENNCYSMIKFEEQSIAAGPATPSCHRRWDTMGCWPPTLPNQTAWIPCPDYLLDWQLNNIAKASRFCMENGTWFQKMDKGGILREWGDYGACNYTRHPNHIIDNGAAPFGNLTERDLRLMYALPYLKKLTVTGYSISLLSLVAAIIVLLGFKRLYCPRNTLHINLFVSFIFRALAVIISRSDFMESDSHASSTDEYYRENGFWCRFSITIFHYGIMANFFWVFIEGCYLNSIMTFSVFTDHSKIWPHIIGGWVPPMIFVGVWATVRATLYDTACWRRENENPGVFWIIRGPITATIVMNFMFFLNIGRIIFLQFKNQTNLREQQTTKLKYRKLAKATLVLLAVFGIHFFFLILAAYLADTLKNADLEIAWLVIELFFGSLQGLFAAVLLCFANGEVRNEISRLIFRQRAAFDQLRRSSSHLSNNRTRNNSDHTLEQVESLRMKPRGSVYTPLAPTNSLKLPATICNQQSCESLYIAHTAENTAHNSDEELEAERGPQTRPIFMREVSQSDTLVES